MDILCREGPDLVEGFILEARKGKETKERATDNSRYGSVSIIRSPQAQRVFNKCVAVVLSYGKKRSA